MPADQTRTRSNGQAFLEGDVQFEGNVGFYDATPVAKQTVTGAKGSNAVPVALGIITDSTIA